MVEFVNVTKDSKETPLTSVFKMADVVELCVAKMLCAELINTIKSNIVNVWLDSLETHSSIVRALLHHVTSEITAACMPPVFHLSGKFLKYGLFVSNLRN